MSNSAKRYLIEMRSDMIQILIVDDEKIERNGIKFLLKQLHMEAEIR